MKILSIDLDFLMGSNTPNFEEDLIESEIEDEQELWNDLYKTHEEKEFDLDPKCIQFLSDVMALNVGKQIPVIPIESHEEMFEILQGTKNLKIVNIDYHHDILYDDDPDLQDLDCGNWAFKLSDDVDTELTHYVWIGTPTSQPCLFDKYFTSKYYELRYDALDMRELHDLLTGFDFIFLCLSKDYFPSKHWNILELEYDYLTKER